MAKTHKFNVNIVAGDKTYERGEPVPIGAGANKVPEGQIASIEAAHGKWTDGGVVKAPDRASGDANRKLAEKDAEIAALKAEMEALKADGGSDDPADEGADDGKGALV